MENVIELHRTDLKVGEKKLKTLTPNSNDWWTVKEKLKMYHIAYSQAANLAVEGNKYLQGKDVDQDLVNDSFKQSHLYFYKHLTEPYRLHKDQFPDGTKKSKEDKTITNLDNEITYGENDNS